MAKEGDEALTITEKIHTCDVCEKSFDSGKALGGHVSCIHVQAANKYNLSPKNLETNIMGKEAASSSFSFICKECGKCFPSTKSLSGHMSCHSERAKRERVQKDMEPPSDGAEIRQANVDLSNSFNACSWPVKAKRGRGAINHPRDAVDSDSDSEYSIEFLYNNAVEQLVRLKKLKEKAKSTLTSASKKFKNAMDGSDEVQTNQGREYTCGTCKKSFPTYQALGGHRSSHSKYLMKLNIFNTVGEDQVQNHEEELYANTNKSGSSIGSELALDQEKYN